MREYGLTILVAAAVTYLFTPLVRRFAIAVGAEHRGRARDVHTEPVPLLGGIAMYLGLAAALLVASRLTHLSTVFVGTRVGSGLLLAGGLVGLMGFVDDRWGLGAITKLAGQGGAGGILVWSGAVVVWLPVPGGGTLSLTSDQQTVLTILVVVVTINAVNFIDGLDGLAAGIVGIGAAAFFLYYYTLTKRLGLDEQTNPALASAILAGVCLGFLPHNFHPARIFMGDTGSMLLGLLLAYVPISSLASLDPSTLTSPSAYSGGTVPRDPAAPGAGHHHAHSLRRPAARGGPADPGRPVPVLGGQETPAAPAAGYWAFAPDQRPDHVLVGSFVRRHRRAAVDYPDETAGTRAGHPGRGADPAARLDAAAAAVEPA